MKNNYSVKDDDRGIYGYNDEEDYDVWKKICRRNFNYDRDEQQRVEKILEVEMKKEGYEDFLHCSNCNREMPLCERFYYTIRRNKLSPLICRRCYRYLRKYGVDWKKNRSPIEKQIKKIYNGMKTRIRCRKYYIGKAMSISYPDFLKFCLDAGYQQMWESAKTRGDKPSVDRIDSSEGYTLDNIQIISQRENCGKAARLGWSRPDRFTEKHRKAIRDGIKRSSKPRKKFCKRGHRLINKNFVVVKGVIIRRCRLCAQIRDKERYIKQKVVVI